ncbi:hypothetical protein B6N60_00134 [Richelia sinica FACHB-800]|uniref:Uncharacterized protein n=1 Tax=Richelia sinica FACHB-800 TaxID=1357546 RepID=A0A975T3L6_9NOST|nr:hypothetical protein B6N60_00134 [Richelia sinica FACHB-800]
MNKNTGGIRQVIGLISRPHPPQPNKILAVGSGIKF